MRSRIRCRRSARPDRCGPCLMILLVFLVVADVGVRRVRISAPELRAGYAAVRRRLGYVDDLADFGSRSSASIPSGRTDGAAAWAWSRRSVQGAPLAAVRQRHNEPVVSTQSGRLLAAKRRAAAR